MGYDCCAWWDAKPASIRNGADVWYAWLGDATQEQLSTSCACSRAEGSRGGVRGCECVVQLRGWYFQWLWQGCCHRPLRHCHWIWRRCWHQVLGYPELLGRQLG